ncbi:hypothetical protein BDDG_01876 [Blastomyces dermatitidis ATCC 18188]|uniref:Zn(2)-C6 fungal-type domain-containing protein n=1 Tax=Ajellomyces dermatitidis (strain ATCC 18188 / CBS 674.68) TaxID=653446 RepID=F2T6X5_AJEDA|nr:hypothetical protein BDDG_01876 [Blastomyces dermatitidis ATCC 18188]
MTRRERKQPESRRRTGCWRCKEKHVQCTEEWPVCSRCERLNLHCVRGLKLLRREDAAQRGIRFGREGTWSKGSSKAVTPTKVEIGHEFQPVSIDHTGFNPYLSLVTPLALNYQQPHEPLRNILLAIAANQRHLLGDSTYEREAFLFKQKALHGLQNETNHRKPSAGAVATITDGCTPSWTTHLRGGLQLMEMFPHQMCENPSEVPQVAHSWLDDDDLEEIDVLMGCSRGLMTLINKISTLGAKKSKAMKTHQLTLQEISNFNTARIDIEAELRVLHQKLPSYASLQEDLLRIAETKRLAAILYLRERLGSPTGLCYFYPVEKFSPHQDHKHKHNNSINSPLSHQATTLSVVETSPSGFKARIVNMIISLMENLPDSPTLLWPLFIVGTVGLDDEAHRRFVLDRLTSIQKTRNLGSVRRACMVVECAYRAKDIHFPRGKVWGDEGPGVISLA